MFLALFVSLALADFDHQHAAFDAVLDGVVSEQGVDYRALAGRRPALDAYTRSLADAPVGSMSPAQQLALYINAYNAYTLTLVLDHADIGSIRELADGNPWDHYRFEVGGQSLTLNQMEHEHVRRLGDARIHAAVNCASVGCPPLADDAFTAGGIEAELDAAARAWVAHNAVSVRGTEVAVSEIFSWYDDDFVAWAAAHGVADPGEHRDTIAFLTHFGAHLPEGDLHISSQPYDWSLNRR